MRKQNCWCDDSRHIVTLRVNFTKLHPTCILVRFGSYTSVIRSMFYVLMMFLRKDDLLIIFCFTRAHLCEIHEVNSVLTVCEMMMYDLLRTYYQHDRNTIFSTDEPNQIFCWFDTCFVRATKLCQRKKMMLSPTDIRCTILTKPVIRRVFVDSLIKYCKHDLMSSDSWKGSFIHCDTPSILDEWTKQNSPGRRSLLFETVEGTSNENVRQTLLRSLIGCAIDEHYLFFSVTFCCARVSNIKLDERTFWSNNRKRTNISSKY